jgi:hypothetical protein
MFKNVLEPHRTTGIVSVSAKTLSGERGAKLINRENQRRGGEFTTFCLEASTGVPKGESKEGDSGDLECSRCSRCGIVVESRRAGWSDDSSGIPDSSADCGLASPTAKVLQNLTLKSVPYPRRRLLADVVPGLSWRNLDFSHHRIQVPEER